MEITLKIRSKYIINEYKNLINKNDKILDIGSGSGYISEIIKKSTKSDVTGIDILDYNKANIRFLKFNGVYIPFKDKYFNIAIFNGVLHHIGSKNQYELLKEAKRVSKKILIFDDDIRSNFYFFMSRIIDIILNLIHNPSMSVPLNFKTKKQFLDMFKRLDLKIVKISYVKTPFWYPLKHIMFELKCLNKKN